MSIYISWFILYSVSYIFVSIREREIDRYKKRGGTREKGKEKGGRKRDISPSLGPAFGLFRLALAR